jgi:hypothetical protein
VELTSKSGGSGPCFSGIAIFLDYQPGKVVPGNDKKSENGHTVASCRMLCWNTAGCKSADLNAAGVCFLNSVRQQVATDPNFSFIDFECCAEGEVSAERMG